MCVRLVCGKEMGYDRGRVHVGYVCVCGNRVRGCG